METRLALLELYHDDLQNETQYRTYEVPRGSVIRYCSVQFTFPSVSGNAGSSLSVHLYEGARTTKSHKLALWSWFDYMKQFTAIGFLYDYYGTFAKNMVLIPINGQQVTLLMQTGQRYKDVKFIVTVESPVPVEKEFKDLRRV